MFALFLSGLAFVPMLIEARRATGNDRRLRAAGAVEPDGDVYGLMRIAYPASFLAMIAEAWVRGSAADGVAFVAGLTVFVVAKALKYWAILTLGGRWTFRVLVPPGSPLIASGPYHFVRHPNYAGVIGELSGMALMAGARVSGVGALAVFSALILVRVGVETRALRAGAPPPGN
jgi:methyltransferase